MAKLSLGWNEWAASDLAAAGFKVFACRGEDDAFGKAKTPIGRWTEEATTDREKLRAIFTRNPKWVPGIKLEDHIIIDPDRHGGIDGIANWEGIIAGKPMPDYVPIVQTPAGQHWYFRQPANGTKLGNREGMLRGLGINVRGVGGYVIGPRSIIRHKKYEFPFELEALINAPEIPAWLVEMIQGEPETVRIEAAESPRKPLEPPSIEVSERARPYFDTAIGQEIAALANMPKGGRNNALNIAAIRMGNFVNEGRITEAEASASLFQAAEACGLVRDDGPNQVMRTIRSGLRAAASKPIKGREISLLHARATDEDIQARVAEVADELAADLILDGNQMEPVYVPPIIRDILMENTTGIIGGQSGVGKTFVTVEMAIAIASGRDFLGRHVVAPGGVLFILAEGGGDFVNRLLAAKREHGITEKLPIVWTQKTGDAPGGLLNPENQAERIAAIVSASRYFERVFGVPLRLTIVDTVNAGFPPTGDENVGYVSAVTRALDLIKRNTGAAAYAVHHFGKDQEKGLRGSSAWRGNVDQVLVMVGEKETPFSPPINTKFIVEKNNRGREGLGFDYDLKEVELGLDPHGFPITSKVVVQAERMSKALSGPARKKEGKSERTFRSAFELCLDQCSFDWETPLKEIIKAVLVESVRHRFSDLYKPSPDDLGIDKEERRSRQASCRMAFNWALQDWKDNKGRDAITPEGEEILFR